MSMTFTVQVDWDADGSFATAGDDISAYVQGVSANLGIFDARLDHVAYVGRCTITLDNTDRRFSPKYTAGPYYGKLLPNRAVRVQGTDGTDTWTLWRGVIRRIVPEAARGGTRETVLECEDAMGVLQAHLLSLPIQEGKRGDELLRLICASAFGGAAATGTVRFTGQPAVGNSVSVGGRTYTFVNTLTGANQVKIEPYRHETARNLAAAINGDAGAGTYYGAGTVRHALVSADDHSHSFEAAGFTGELPLGRISGMWLKQAQSFTPRVDSYVTRIRFTLGNSFGSPTSTITWSIQTDNAGLPSGTVVQSGIVAPTPNTQHTVNVTGTLLTGEQTYWLVLELTSDQPDNTGYYVRSHNPSIFTGGTHAQYNSATGGWQTYDYDLNFEVSLGGIVTFTALARGTGGNAITLSRVGANITVSGATLGGGTDGDRTLTFDTSGLTHDIAADQWAADRTTALGAVSDVIASEGAAFLWGARDGSIVYKDKSWWFGLPTASAVLDLDDVGDDLEAPLDVADIYNEVTLSYRPRTTKSTGVVAKANDTIEVPVTTRDPRWNTTKDLPDGGKYVLRLPYIDPDTGQAVGAKDIITPVAGTDFHVWESIGGRDYTDKGWVSVSVAPTGSGVECTFINHGGTPFYVTDFQVRGTAIISYEPVQSIRQDTASIATYGRRPIEYNVPLYSNQTFSESLADYLLYQYTDARQRVRRLLFTGAAAVGGGNVFDLEIGDVVTISNYQNAITSERYVVCGMSYQLYPNDSWALWLYVAPVYDLTYWVLDDTTYSRLGVTTRLSL